MYLFLPVNAGKKRLHTLISDHSLNFLKDYKMFSFLHFKEQKFNACKATMILLNIAAEYTTHTLM